MNIKLVADSSANLHTAQNLNVAYAPLKIIAGDAEYVDDGRLDIPAMLTGLQEYKGRSSTACPGVHDWLDTFGEADMVLGVTITSALSGSYNAARIAAEEYAESHPGAQVYIHDSLSAGPELQLLLEKYQELADAGLEFDAICDQARAYAAKTHLVFSLESLDNLSKNGRVNPILAKAIGLLGIRLVGRASEQGTLEPTHKCRGEKKAVQQALHSMKDLGFHGGKVRITHTYNAPAAEALAELIRDEFPNADIAISLNRGLCCYYSEQGGLLIGFEGK